MVSHARSAGLDAKKYLTNNDAFTFFSNLQDSHYLVNTGLTGTNVMDIQVLLIHPSLWEWILVLGTFQASDGASFIHVTHQKLDLFLIPFGAKT